MIESALWAITGQEDRENGESLNWLSHEPIISVHVWLASISNMATPNYGRCRAIMFLDAQTRTVVCTPLEFLHLNKIKYKEGKKKSIKGN